MYFDYVPALIPKNKIIKWLPLILCLIFYLHFSLSSSTPTCLLQIGFFFNEKISRKFYNFSFSFHDLLEFLFEKKIYFLKNLRFRSYFRVPQNSTYFRPIFFCCLFRNKIDLILVVSPHSITHNQPSLLMPLNKQ